MAKVYATKPYNLCQIGKETTKGTAVAATAVMRGPFAMAIPNGDPEVLDEAVGSRIIGERNAPAPLTDVSLAMPEMALSYEQFPYLLEASVKPVTPSGSNPYTYEYEPSDTSPDARTYTLRLGNKLVATDQQIVPFSWVEEWKATYKSDQATWRMSATWRGQRMYAGAFTNSVALPSVVEALTGNTRLYIDNSGGTIGTTEAPGVLLEFSLTYRSGIRWVPIGGSNRYPAALKFGKPSVDFTIRYELEEDTGVSRVATERSAADAGTLRLIRVKCPGTGSRDLIFDMAAKYRKPGGYDEQDENVNVAFDGYATYSSADALFFKTTVINLLSSLT